MQTFSIYIIEIGKNSKKLLINYSLENPEDKLNDFMRKNKRFVGSQLRYDLLKSPSQFRDHKQANNTARGWISGLKSKGFEVIAGSPLHSTEYKVYVLMLNGNSRHVYVGQSKYPPTIRLMQHRNGFNRAPKLKNFKKLELHPYLNDSIKGVIEPVVAKLEESNLKRELESKGYKVLGGH